MSETEKIRQKLQAEKSIRAVARSIQVAHYRLTDFASGRVSEPRSEIILKLKEFFDGNSTCV